MPCRLMMLTCVPHDYCSKPLGLVYEREAPVASHGGPDCAAGMMALWMVAVCGLELAWEDM